MFELLITEEFAKFPNNANFVLPAPADVDDYQMSRDYIGVPKKSVERYGAINDILPQQADIVTDLVFEQLRINEFKDELIVAALAFTDNPNKGDRLMLNCGAKMARNTSIRWKNAGFASQEVTNAVENLTDQDLEELFLRVSRSAKPIKARSKSRSKSKSRSRSSASSRRVVLSSSDNDETEADGKVHEIQDKDDDEVDDHGNTDNEGDAMDLDDFGIEKRGSTAESDDESSDSAQGPAPKRMSI